MSLQHLLEEEEKEERDQFQSDPSTAAQLGEHDYSELIGEGAGMLDPSSYTQPKQPIWAGAASAGSGSPASAKDPMGGNAEWNALPQEYRNELTDLEHQWQVDTGFLMSVTPEQLLQMGRNGVLTESDFGQFMATQMSGDQQKQIPWGMFGMTKDTYVATINSYAQSFFDLTGKSLDVVPGAAGDFDFIKGYLNKSMTSGQFADALQNDTKMRDTYGWLKYGYNFQQFQQFKTDQTRYLGTTMDDSQALLQLQYRHTNAGPSMSAVAYAPSPGQQTTKTIGVEGSVAR